MLERKSPPACLSKNAVLAWHEVSLLVGLRPIVDLQALIALKVHGLVLKRVNLVLGERLLLLHHHMVANCFAPLQHPLHNVALCCRRSHLKHLAHLEREVLELVAEEHKEAVNRHTLDALLVEAGLVQFVLLSLDYLNKLVKGFCGVSAVR